MQREFAIGEVQMNTDNLSYGSDYHYLPVTSVDSGEFHEAAADVAGYTVQIVNVCFVGLPGGEDWVLVDAGMPGSAESIIEAAESRYGEGCKPQCILLTHGHFDHVGAIIELVDRWHVPVYAHPAELPYLTGKESYPEPDPTVEGGMVATMSPLFPIRPIQLGAFIHALPDDGSVPDLPGWTWIHTPGHTAGHVSFFREKDRVLIAGDAFVNVKQESLYKVIMQEEEISGPPRYLTTEWELARVSVNKLRALEPRSAITGHGRPLIGSFLEDGLARLVERFDEIAIPKHGKYVN
jgi:glyoxylase-like metal-dependent hydrolase (beta-lactamase superfamily II)